MNGISTPGANNNNVTQPGNNALNVPNVTVPNNVPNTVVNTTKSSNKTDI